MVPNHFKNTIFSINTEQHFKINNLNIIVHPINFSSFDVFLKTNANYFKNIRSTKKKIAYINSMDYFTSTT